jgi:hypothetical protein
MAPFRALAIFFLILPAVAVWRRFPRKSPDPVRRCSTCAYNLTGNASGVCPECGIAIKV